MLHRLSVSSKRALNPDRGCPKCASMNAFGSINPFPANIRVSVGRRDPLVFPHEDGRLGQAIYSRLESTILKGKLPRPTALAFHEEQLTQYDLLPLLKGRSDVHRFLSAVSGQSGLEAVATVGLVRMGPPRATQRPLGAMCFVEWPDSRWWWALRLLEERNFRDDWPLVVRQAQEGDPRPGGVGGWFSRGRRERLRLNAQMESAGRGLQQVH